MCGAVEAALAGDDHPLGEVAQHRVGRLLERPPGAVAARAAGLAPDDLAAQEQAEVVLEDADDVGRERAVRLAAEVGDVDRDAPARLELGDALGEDVLEHREVLEVGGRDVALAERLLVGLAGEVRRRGDDERHRRGPHAVHRAGVADVDLVDHAGRLDRVVGAQHRGGEAGVEAAGVVVLAPGHAEARRGGGPLALRARLRAPATAANPLVDRATRRTLRRGCDGAGHATDRRARPRAPGAVDPVRGAR